MEIAFLGLGIMGSRMAANLVRAGYSLTVWNRSRDKTTALTALGAQRAETPAEAARDKDIVITMLSEPRAVEPVALGAQGFLDAMQSGALWMDASTVNPSFSHRMAAEAEKRGVRFLDAPVAGSKDPAEKGQLLFLVGGKEADLEQARPLMDVMGRAVIHAGDTGMGAALKMVFNMLLAQAMLSFAEGLVLGEALGLPREHLLDILGSSAVVAPVAAGKRAKIEAGDYRADFPLQWMQKDLELVSLTAYEQGLALPSANVAKAIYMLAARYGLAEQDFSAIYPFLQENRRDESLE